MPDDLGGYALTLDGGGGSHGEEAGGGGQEADVKGVESCAGAMVRIISCSKIFSGVSGRVCVVLDRLLCSVQRDSFGRHFANVESGRFCVFFVGIYRTGITKGCRLRTEDCRLHSFRRKYALNNYAVRRSVYRSETCRA